MPPPPSFDTWTIVFLIAAVQGFFIALVLLRWRRGNRLANALLATLLIFFALSMTEYVLYWTGHIFQFIHAANLTAQLPFLFGPLVWFYLRTIFHQKGLQRNDSWHVVPFLLAIIAYWPWLSLDAEAKRAVTQTQTNFPVKPVVEIILQWGRVAHLLGYALWNSWYIHRQPRVGQTNRWAVLLNAFFFGFALAYTSYFVLVRFPFFNLSWDYHISAAMTAFIYLIAYSGYVQPAVFEGFAWSEPEAPVKYRNSSLTSAASSSLLKKLSDLMNTDHLYRDPEISLDSLASRLDASKHHVSQIINEHLEVSFFEYINQLRIEEAKRLLAETTRGDLHVIEAAYAVGFNNKVSFNTAFKKATGMTPTEYRKSHGQTDNTAGQPGAVGEGGA